MSRMSIVNSQFYWHGKLNDKLKFKYKIFIKMSVVKKEILLGDCLELYKDIEPKSIDLILTDLPYGTTACKWDTIIPFDKLWEMVNYLLKPNGAFITTASQPFTSALVMSNPKMFRYSLVWNKKFAGNFANANRCPMKTHEDILLFYLKQPTFNPLKTKRDKPIKTGKISNPEFMFDKKFKQTKKEYNEKFPISILDFPRDIGRTIHPTQKPIALFEYLLKTYTNEGMTIFDPCMGSGTTGVACINTNRNFIGIEKDETYFNIAKNRIEQQLLSPELFT